MTAEKFQVGDIVRRIASDYTNGRIGSVIEIPNQYGGQGGWDGRYRVKWKTDGSGKPLPGNGIRTWVDEKFIEPLIKKA
jgi:hypothetical protein